MATGNKTDWANFIKQYTAEQQKVSDWDTMFTNMFEQQYKAGVTGLEQQAQKDIASAYGNYVASQIQLKHLDGITTGYKDTLNKTLDNAYTKSVYDTDTALAQNKNALLLQTGQEIADYKAKAEESIEKDAVRMLKYQKDLLKHASTASFDGKVLRDEFSDIFTYDANDNVVGWSDNAKNFMYENYDPNNPNSLTYSDQGKRFMGYLLQGFGDWAQSNYDEKEYSDWVESGYGMFNNAVFGNDINPYSGDTYDVTELADTSRYSKILESKNTLGINEITDGKKLSTKDVSDIFTLYGRGSDTVLEKIHKDKAPTVASYYMLKGGEDIRFTDADADSRWAIKPGSETENKVLKMAQTEAALLRSGKLKKGDVFDNGDFLTYYDGGAIFKYAPDTPETREKLAKAGIKIGK